jgi:hypothetical protein
MKLTLTNFFRNIMCVSFCTDIGYNGLFDISFIENADGKKCQAPTEPGITTFNY